MRLRFGLCIALALAVFLAPKAASAQATVDDVVRCKTLADRGRRLACFDTLFSYVQPQAPVAAPAQPYQAQPYQGYAPAQPYQAQPYQTQPYQPRATPQAPPAASPPPSDDDFGRRENAEERAAKRNRSIRYKIVEITKGPRGEALYHLENGQVWRQLDGKRSTLRTGEYATIKPNPYGKTFRLYTSGRNGSIAVKRVR